MKKIFAFLSVILLAFVSIITVNAATGKITISGAIEGETYNAYRLLDLYEYTPGSNATYSYVLRTDEGNGAKWANFFNQDSISGSNGYFKLTTVGGKTYATWRGENTAQRAKAFADAAFAYAKANNITADATSTAANVDGSVVAEMSNISLGYYLVDSSVGVLCSLNTTATDVRIEEKNTKDIPTVDKDIVGSPTKNSTTKNIGDSVEFTIAIDNTLGFENVVFNDTMSNGLTLNKQSIKVNGNEITSEVGKLTTTDQTIKIEFNESFISSNNDETITVTYSAVLNSNAVIGVDGNTNEATISWGNNQKTEKSVVTVYTYKFAINKVDENNASLTGAVFTLSKDGVVLTFTSIDEGYRFDKNGTVSELSAGNIVISGLEAGTYTLTEVSAPKGYNKLGAAITVVIDANGNVTKNGERLNGYSFDVINTTGTVLPSTGGIGTIIFIVIGSLITIVFAVALIAKIRIQKNN